MTTDMIVNHLMLALPQRTWCVLAVTSVVGSLAFTASGQTNAPAASADPPPTATPVAAPPAAPNGVTNDVSPAAPTPTEPAAPPPYPEAPPVEGDVPPPANSEAEAETAPVDGLAIYEPPLPQAYSSRDPDEVAAVPAPPTPRHLAPRSSFWVGARPGLFVPLGSAWLDGEPFDGLCCVESARPWSEFAGPGPSLTFDAGVRFGRHYQGFAFYEHAWLSSGALDDAFGGQDDASTSVFGGGFRFSTHPDAIGMIVEISLGYRTFEANWATGTRLTASDDLFSTRLGFGVEWRVNRHTSLELLMMVGGGSFTNIRWRFADGSRGDALTVYDRYGQYIPFGIQLASHWDVIASDD